MTHYQAILVAGLVYEVLIQIQYRQILVLVMRPPGIPWQRAGMFVYLIVMFGQWFIHGYQRWVAYAVLGTALINLVQFTIAKIWPKSFSANQRGLKYLQAGLNQEELEDEMYQQAHEQVQRSC